MRSPHHHKLFLERGELLKNYQACYQPYIDFKNAPFPRMENETELMIGTEGQLGLVLSAEIKTVPHVDVTYLFMLLPKWEADESPHLEIFSAVQDLRGPIISCEHIDDNSLSVLKEEDRPGEAGQDLIFLEVKTQHFEEVYEQMIQKLSSVSEDCIFEISPSKCRQLRMSIPRATFEMNSQMGVVKKGTDVQVHPEKFKELLSIYRSWSESGIRYNLFGHFGDAHLHFNFLPTKDQVPRCEKYLEDLYKKVKVMQGSPFAEHGIGLIKQKFIEPFYTSEVSEMFNFLKKSMDPHSQFFPQGFMGGKTWS